MAWPNRATRLSQSFHGNSLEESRWPNVSLRNHHSGSHSPSPSKCETKRRGEPFSLASNGTGVALAVPRNLASPSQHVVCCRSFPRVSTNCLVWPGHGGSPLLRDREDAVQGEVQAQVSTARNGGIGSYRSCNCPLSSPDWMPLTTAVQRSLDIEYRACRSTDLPKLTAPMAADWPSLSTNHRGPSLAQEGWGACLPSEPPCGSGCCCLSFQVQYTAPPRSAGRGPFSHQPVALDLTQASSSPTAVLAVKVLTSKCRSCVGRRFTCLFKSTSSQPRRAHTCTPCQATGTVSVPQ